jgi:hypothetical protein
MAEDRVAEELEALVAGVVLILGRRMGEGLDRELGVRKRCWSLASRWARISSSWVAVIHTVPVNVPTGRLR